MAGANRRRQPRLTVPEAPGAAEISRVPVLLPLPLPGPLDYRVPDDVLVRPGDLVLIPLGRREVLGVVWDGAADAEVPDQRLRPLEPIPDAPPMRTDLRRLVD